ncbi:MAG: hypothetical protein IPK32_18320 [Verrucomicrobiaceae bacterium]|nr:hypothetical protein [Verrucomicrobiaceae bacterium]
MMLAAPWIIGLLVLLAILASVMLAMRSPVAAMRTLLQGVMIFYGTLLPLAALVWIMAPSGRDESRIAWILLVASFAPASVVVLCSFVSLRWVAIDSPTRISSPTGIFLLRSVGLLLVSAIIYWFYLETMGSV